MRKKGCSVIDWIAGTLVIIGALNWGLFGLFEIDLVSLLLGGFNPISRAVYILVGVAGIWMFFAGWRFCSSPCNRSDERL